MVKEKLTAEGMKLGFRTAGYGEAELCVISPGSHAPEQVGVLQRCRSLGKECATFNVGGGCFHFSRGFAWVIVDG